MLRVTSVAPRRAEEIHVGVARENPLQHEIERDAVPMSSVTAVTGSMPAFMFGITWTIQPAACRPSVG